MTRLPYVTEDDISPDARPAYERVLRSRASPESGGGMPHSFQTLFNSPGAAEAVAGLGEYLRFNSSLDPVVREIAILSTARELGSQYEWAHHEPVARKAGVRDEVIESIRTGRAPMGLPAKEGVFAQAAKELAGKGTLSDRTFQAVDHLLGPAGTVDLVVLVGFFAMIATALRALDVEMEPGLKPSLPEAG